MPPRNKRPKKGLHRIDAALDAMRPLGFANDAVRKSVKDLLKVYGDEGWIFIEEGSYRVLIDALLSGETESVQEPDAEKRCVLDSSNLQRNAETSANEQGSEMVSVDYDRDSKVIDEIGVSDKEMENQSKCIDKTIRAETRPFGVAKDIDDTQQLHVGFASKSSLPKMETKSSNRLKKPCYGWISDDEEDDEVDNLNIA
ncbi:unnamed protein product [Cuscuta europaea]|uniref:WIYLD domain-containing protein n=1 Tax=Cuscuta europaea TaxID=41803 RepID=A0A9P1EDP6_CUSEU|nr:unnamed protein product [Cuscuta europaea]